MYAFMEAPVNYEVEYASAWIILHRGILNGQNMNTIYNREVNLKIASKRV